MSTIWIPVQLTSADSAEFAATARLLDAMAQYHTERVAEVFDYHRPTKTAEYVDGLVKAPDSYVWVVRDDGKVIGVLYGAIKSSAPTPGWRPRRYGYIEAMYVDDNYRAQGIAHALMQSAHDFFKAQGLTVVELNVWAFNTEARSLYAKLDYEPKNINLWKQL